MPVLMKRNMTTSSTDGRPHYASLDPDALSSQCEFRTTRRSGPGGQNRNKVETAVILTHRPTGIVAEASERRSQNENRREALFRLRLQLALEIRSPTETAPYHPSPLWRSRLRGGKIVVSPEHDDFPALLAEALDVLEDRSHDVKLAAEALDCSSTQLVKLLAAEPRALGQINAQRARAGLRALR